MSSSAGCRFENTPDPLFMQPVDYFTSPPSSHASPLLLNIPPCYSQGLTYILVLPSAFLFTSLLFLKLASRLFCTPPVPLLFEAKPEYFDCCARALLFS